jgi:osmotically-inducible protein OsmY
MPQPPSSYDDIVRRTVPNPDSSFRPSKLQEQQAREGFRMLDEDEHELHDRVRAALGGAQIDVEIDRKRVILRGHVANGAMYSQLEDRVRAVEGVDEVENGLIIRG